MDTEDREIGLSNECIESLKRYPNSILNGKFLNELREVCRAQVPQADILLLRLVQTLKNKLAFDEAMSAINPDDLYYVLKGVTIAPSEFQSRLPENIHSAFLQMLGHLTFARAQHFFPIAAFEDVWFLTALNDEEKREWMQDRLLICLRADYAFIGVEDSPLPKPIQDEIDIVHDPSSVTPIPSRQTLRDAISSALSRTNGDVVISEELEIQLKKQTNGCRNAADIEKVICALAMVWLPEYAARREQYYSYDQACEMARQKFRQAVSHDITGESERVHNDPELKKPRQVTCDGECIEAFLHVKIAPRLYFGVRSEKVSGQKTKHTIVLGHVGHLETARHGASSGA